MKNYGFDKMIGELIKEAVAPYKKKLHTMYGQNGGLKAANNKLRNQIDEKDFKISELSEKVKDLNSELSDLESKANSNCEEVQKIKAEVDRLHRHIKQVKEQRDFMYYEYEKEIANLKAELKASDKSLNQDVAYYYYPTETSNISFATKKLMQDCKKLRIKNKDGKNFMDREIRTFLEYSDRFELFSEEEAIKILNNLGVR